MQVGHRFPAVRPVVDHQPIPTVEVQLLRHRGRLEQQVAEQLVIFRLCFADAGDGLLWDDENMRWRLGVDVTKSAHLIVLEYDLGGNLPRDDFFENGLAHSVSVAGAPRDVKPNPAVRGA